jgi:hypothetical protein
MAMAPATAASSAPRAGAKANPSIKNTNVQAKTRMTIYGPGSKQQRCPQCAQPLSPNRFAKAFPRIV